MLSFAKFDLFYVLTAPKMFLNSLLFILKDQFILKFRRITEIEKSCVFSSLLRVLKTQNIFNLPAKEDENALQIGLSTSFNSKNM